MPHRFVFTVFMVVLLLLNAVVFWYLFDIYQIDSHLFLKTAIGCVLVNTALVVYTRYALFAEWEKTYLDTEKEKDELVKKLADKQISYTTHEQLTTQLQTAQNQLLSFVSSTQNQFSDFTATLCQVMNVTSSGIYQITNEGLSCIDFYSLSQNIHETDTDLDRRDLPVLFAELHEKDKTVIRLHEPAGWLGIYGISHILGGKFIAAEQEYVLLVFLSNPQQNFTVFQQQIIDFALKTAALFTIKNKTENKLLSLTNTKNEFDYFRANSEIGIAQFVLKKPIATQNITEREINLLLAAPLKEANDRFWVLNRLKPAVYLLSQLTDKNALEELLTHQNFSWQAEIAINSVGGKNIFVQRSLHAYVVNGFIHAFWLTDSDVTLLRQDVDFYNRIIRNSDTFLTMTDEALFIKYDSPSVAKRLRFEPIERQYTSLLSFVHPQDSAQLTKLTDLAKEKNNVQYFHALRLRNRSNEYVETDGNVVYLGEKGFLFEFHRPITRIEAQNKLLKEKAFFRTLTENNGLAVSILDTKGFIRYESSNIASLLGYKPDIRLGRLGFEYFDRQDVAELTQNFEKALKTKVPILQNARFLHAAGHWCDVEITWVNLLEEDSVKGVMMIWQDISERIRTDKIRATTEQRYQVAFENISSLTWIIDQEGRIIVANQAVNKELGYTNAELAEQKFIEYIHPNEKIFVKNNLEYLKNNPYNDLKMSFRFKNTQQNWCYLTVKATLLKANQKNIGILIEAQDNTSQLEKEKLLTEKLEFFDKITNELPEIIVLLDPQGNIIFTNQYTKKILGYQLKGSLKSRIHPEDIHAFHHAFEESTTLEEIFVPCKIRLIDKDGTWNAFDCKIANYLKEQTLKGILLRISPTDILEDSSDLVSIFFETLRQAPDFGLVLTDSQHKIDYFTEGFKKILVASAEEINEKPIYNFFADVAFQAWEQIKNETAKSYLTTHTQVLQLKTAKNTTKFVEVYAQARLKTSGLVLIFKDVTAQSTELATMRLASAQWKNIADYSAAPLCVTDEKGNICIANAALSSLLSTPTTQLQTSNFKQLVPNNEKPKLQQLFDQSLRFSWKPCSEHFTLKTHNGELKHCVVTFTSYIEKDKTRYLVVNFSDLTKIDWLETELSKNFAEIENLKKVEEENIRISKQSYESTVAQVEKKEKDLAALQERYQHLLQKAMMGWVAGQALSVSKNEISNATTHLTDWQTAQNLASTVHDLYAELTTKADLPAKLTEIRSVKDALQYGETIAAIQQHTDYLKDFFNKTPNLLAILENTDVTQKTDFLSIIRHCEKVASCIFPKLTINHTTAPTFVIKEPTAVENALLGLFLFFADVHNERNINIDFTLMGENKISITIEETTAIYPSSDFYLIENNEANQYLPHFSEKITGVWLAKTMIEKTGNQFYLNLQNKGIQVKIILT
jgi:PAS domain S-box-containing protein